MTKPTNWHVRPGKTQISLGICPVWSESSVCTIWVVKDLMLLHADSERLWSDWADAQADLNLCWAHRSFCWFCRELAQINNRPLCRPQWSLILVQTCLGKQCRPRSVSGSLIRVYTVGHFDCLFWTQYIIEIEPHHEKTCSFHMRTTKAQISLRIRAVWSAPLLFTA